jgi:hypothetical protein
MNIAVLVGMKDMEREKKRVFHGSIDETHDERS